jgi:lantibiotic modifying enzyme
MTIERAVPPLAGRDVAAALGLALAAEHWIARHARPAGSGRIWSVADDEPDAVDLSLYHGAAGVVLFYLELAAATGERRYLDEAIAGADGIVALTAAAGVEAPDHGVGLYRGAAGLAFVLDQVYRAGGEERHRRAAEAAIATVLTRAVERGAGLGWIEPIPFAEAFGLEGTTETFDVSHGSAGVALALLYAAQRGLHPRALETARRVGERLLEVATPNKGGLAWPMMQEPVDWTAPNFSHGTAGVAYCLARLHAATREPRFLDAALAGARHLCAIATVEGASRCVHHSSGRGEDLYYMAWCHGPPGTARLFQELAEQTGDAEWREWLCGGGEALLKFGVPERRSRGFWNNVGQCCGDAGAGEFALSLWRATGDRRFLELARRVGRSLEERSSVGGDDDSAGRFWLQAEHRVKPELLQAQTGYMQGAAGIGSFLLRRWAVETQRPSPKIQLPDCPFPA